MQIMREDPMAATGPCSDDPRFGHGVQIDHRATVSLLKFVGIARVEVKDAGYDCLRCAGNLQCLHRSIGYGISQPNRSVPGIDVGFTVGRGSPCRGIQIHANATCFLEVADHDRGRECSGISSDVGNGDLIDASGDRNAVQFAKGVFDHGDSASCRKRMMRRACRLARGAAA